MRMRFKPYAHDELMAADFHVHEPLIWGGRWHAQYARPEQPFVLELGCGKGGFISQLACAHPENNYLGIDITDKVLILAKRKIEAAYQAAGRPIDNVKIMSTDIERIKGVITAEDTVSYGLSLVEIGSSFLAAGNVHSAGICHSGQLAREQIVAGVAIGDLVDLVLLANALDILLENHFHDVIPHFSPENRCSCCVYSIAHLSLLGKRKRLTI